MSLYSNTTASGNTAVGYSALEANTGGSNTAVGNKALEANTTASNNTAVGYQAGYRHANSGGLNTFIGDSAGYSSTDQINTFVGSTSGYYMSTGSKNTILGRFDGNQGGLDIRTSSNNIVL